MILQLTSQTLSMSTVFKCYRFKEATREKTVLLTQLYYVGPWLTTHPYSSLSTLHMCVRVYVPSLKHVPTSHDWLRLPTALPPLVPRCHRCTSAAFLFDLLSTQLTVPFSHKHGQSSTSVHWPRSVLMKSSLAPHQRPRHFIITFVTSAVSHIRNIDAHTLMVKEAQLDAEMILIAVLQLSRADEVRLRRGKMVRREEQRSRSEG